MAKYKLTYFDCRFRAEFARLVLAQAGVDYQDIRLTREEWKPLRETGISPYGQLPLMEFDGKVLTQSRTIACFLAREHGLYGTNNLEAATIDMILDGAEDILNAVLKFMSEQDETKKDALKKRFFDVTLPNILSGMEKILMANNGGNGYFIGDEVTIADIKLYDIAEMVAAGMPGVNILTKYEKLNALRNRVAALPNIAKWLEIRPQTEI